MPGLSSHEENQMLMRKQGLEKRSLNNPCMFAFHLEFVSSPCCLQNEYLRCVHGHVLQVRKLGLNSLSLKSHQETAASWAFPELSALSSCPTRGS